MWRKNNLYCILVIRIEKRRNFWFGIRIDNRGFRVGRCNFVVDILVWGIKIIDRNVNVIIGFCCGKKRKGI